MQSALKKYIWNTSKGCGCERLWTHPHDVQGGAFLLLQKYTADQNTEN